MNTTSSWVEPPPPKTGMGCFAKGCLILVIFAVLLLAACIAGIFWGARNYSTFHRGFSWLLKTNAVSETPASIPEFTRSDSEIRAVQERWDRFDHTVHQGEPAEIELTAEDINALVNSNPHLDGKVFASIDGNRLRLQASFPLQQRIARATHYINLDVIIEAEGPISLDHPQLDRITVNGRSLPNDLLEWTWHSERLRDLLSESREANRAGSIEIRDGRLMLKSRTN